DDEALGDGRVDRTVEAQAGDAVVDELRQVERRDVGRPKAGLYVAELAQVVDDLAHQVRLANQALRKPAPVLRLWVAEQALGGEAQRCDRGFSPGGEGCWVALVSRGP